MPAIRQPKGGALGIRHTGQRCLVPLLELHYLQLVMLALPALVAHADWSTTAGKRWIARATRTADATYLADRPELVGDATTLVARLAAQGSALLGVDFAIGLPRRYAERAGVANFLSFLHHADRDDWRDVLTLATQPSEISVRRPFYPQRPGGTRHAHLLEAHGATSMDDLRRRCEYAHPERRAAAPLFSTLGGQQVGRAAIAGWREMLIPALRNRPMTIQLWPFMGGLPVLLARGGVTIAETYPAESYRHLGVTFPSARRGERGGKRVQSARRANAAALLAWAARHGVGVTDALHAEIADGFGPRFDGEDRFDAVVGLLGMLAVILGERDAGECDDAVIRTTEGWILGQPVPADLRPPSTPSSLHPYLRTTYWAFTASDALAMRANCMHPHLDAVLTQHGAQHWAYLTAHNPSAETAKRHDNHAAQRQLAALLDANGLTAYPGFGVGDDGVWPPEDSLLVIDIARDDAVALGRRFAQDAVVVGTRDAPAIVLDIRSDPPRAWTA